MKPPVPGWDAITTREPVLIPTLEGGVAETLWIEVPAWRNPKTGQVFLSDAARATLEKVKARHLGLLTPAQIKTLRIRLGLTQKQISRLLQVGKKSWTRWETGKERPSRSMNVLLRALSDERIDPDYLQGLLDAAQPQNRPSDPMALPSDAVLRETPRSYRASRAKKGKGVK